MNTAIDRHARRSREPRHQARLVWHWSVLALILGLALTVSHSSARAEECSDFTENNRPCTATEEFGYCLNNAMDSYEDCKDGASFVTRIGCAFAYDVDFWACAAGLPVKIVGDALE